MFCFIYIDTYPTLHVATRSSSHLHTQSSCSPIPICPSTSSCLADWHMTFNALLSHTRNQIKITKAHPSSPHRTSIYTYVCSDSFSRSDYPPLHAHHPDLARSPFQLLQHHPTYPIPPVHGSFALEDLKGVDLVVVQGLA